MTRLPLIAAAAAAVLTIPATAAGNVAATCTTDGVAVTLTGFTGTHQVPWTVTQGGRQVAAGTQTVTGTTTFTVPTPGVTGQVVVRASWGPVPTRDTGTAVTGTGCAPTPPAAPEPTPAVLEPPAAPAPPVVTIAPPIPTPVVVPAKRPTCAQLRARDVGAKYLVRNGCARASSTSARACRAGTFRVVVRGRTYCLASRPRPVRPAVTG